MWTLNSIQLITQDFDESGQNIIARLQPLSGGTVLHKFGYESITYSLGCIVVGNTDKDALLAMAKSQSTYTLVTPHATITNVSVASAKASQKLGIIGQTIRQDLDCDAPVFDMVLELYVED